MDKMSIKEQIAFHQQQALIFSQLATAWGRWNPDTIKHGDSYAEDLTKKALDHAKEAEELFMQQSKPSALWSFPKDEVAEDPYKNLDKKHRALFESDIRIMKDAVGVRFLNALALFSVSTVGQMFSVEPYKIFQEPGIGGITIRKVLEWVKENVDIQVLMSGGPVDYEWYRAVNSK